MATLGTAYEHRNLRPVHMVGRGPGSDLLIAKGTVSTVHARLRYHEGWTLRDLDSRNGTFVNGSRITGEVRLGQGAQIGFGDPDATWTLRDDSPPGPFAVSLERPGARWEVAGSHGTLALPDAAACAVHIARGRRGWVAESADAVWRVHDLEEIDALGRWVLHLPDVGAPRTLPAHVAVHLVEATVQLLTSPDLEHIEVCVSHRGGVFRLDHTVCHELLYVLARARLDGDHQGWVPFEELARRLSLDASRVRDSNRLRSWIHRLRKRFEHVGLCDGARIVERREGTREVRLGVRAVRVDPAAQPHGAT